MPWGIDKVELVDLSIGSGIVQRYRLRLNSNTPLTLDIHGVEHLLLQLTFRQTATGLNQTIRERRFTVVDMRDDGEIANMLELSAGNVMRHRVCSALLVRKRGGAALGRRAKNRGPHHCIAKVRQKISAIVAICGG